MASRKITNLLHSAYMLRLAKFQMDLKSFQHESSITALDKRVLDDNYLYFFNMHFEELASLDDQELLVFFKHDDFIAKNGFLTWTQYVTTSNKT